MMKKNNKKNGTSACKSVCLRSESKQTIKSKRIRSPRVTAPRSTVLVCAGVSDKISFSSALTLSHLRAMRYLNAAFYTLNANVSEEIAFQCAFSTPPWLSHRAVQNSLKSV